MTLIAPWCGMALGDGSTAFGNNTCLKVGELSNKINDLIMLIFPKRRCQFMFDA